MVLGCGIARLRKGGRGTPMDGETGLRNISNKRLATSRDAEHRTTSISLLFFSHLNACLITAFRDFSVNTCAVVVESSDVYPHVYCRNVHPSFWHPRKHALLTLLPVQPRVQFSANSPFYVPFTCVCVVQFDLLKSPVSILISTGSYPSHCSPACALRLHRF